MNLLLAFKALFLGIIEGLTEFLPISSTGHLIVAGSLIGFDAESHAVFNIAIQLGAILAVVYEYRARFIHVATHIGKDRLSNRFVLNLAIAFIPAAAIGLLYAPALVYGEHTHISIMEYWRWWVVHLWVEGFFEVFATTAVGFIFYNLGMVSKRAATTAALLAAMLFMIGGIPGTFHHLYFAGTTTPILAIGAMFSALEVVPLVLLGYDAFENWTIQHKSEWMKPMRWPLTFFIAVSFWNMLGAGVFGFLINPPISLYYLQGLNTTPNHGHAALFGVYGFLALGFSLMVLRYIRPTLKLNNRLMGISFVALNLGLALMLFTSLLPVGIIQANASISVGLWWARSAEFVEQTPIIHTLRWVRTIGDMIFICGAAAYGLQMVLGLMHKETGADVEKA